MNRNSELIHARCLFFFKAMVLFAAVSLLLLLGCTGGPSGLPEDAPAIPPYGEEPTADAPCSVDVPEADTSAGVAPVKDLTLSKAGGFITITFTSGKTEESIPEAGYVVIEGPAPFQFYPVPGATYAIGETIDGYTPAYAGEDTRVVILVDPAKDYSKVVFGVSAVSSDYQYSPPRTIASGSSVVTVSSSGGGNVIASGGGGQAPVEQYTWTEFGITEDAPRYVASETVAIHPGKRTRATIFAKEGDGIYLFGGATFEDGLPQFRSDTWKWSAGGWEFRGDDQDFNRPPSGGDPGARDNYAYATSGADRLWIYGGIRRVSFGYKLADLYEIDLTNGSASWHFYRSVADSFEVLPANRFDGGSDYTYSPGGRMGGVLSVISDEAGMRIELSGGLLEGQLAADTWTFNPQTAAWTLVSGSDQVFPDETPSPSPPESVGNGDLMKTLFLCISLYLSRYRTINNL